MANTFNLKYLLSLSLLLVCLQSYAQKNSDITIGKTYFINSNILKEQRKILVYVPNSGNTNVKSESRYPVIYLLDGEQHFHSVTGLVQYLSSTGKIPEMMVVGIVNTNRVKDLTPTHSISWSDGEKDPDYFKHAGGGEKFISFIQKELMPHIDSLYHPEPYRMIVGHSLGGLTVINALFNHPALFNSYVAIDPSIWWDDHLFLKKAATVLKQSNFAGKALFFASANTLNKGKDTIDVLKDTSNSSVHVRDNILFHQLLKGNIKNNLSWAWKYYEDDDHPSVPLIAEYDALRTFFKNYELSKSTNDTSINADFIRDHYKNVSAMLGYQVLPSRNTVNGLGYIHMGNKSFNKAYSFFQMNIDNYSENFNVYDSMGDYYIAIGNKQKAKEFFKKALILHENPDTRKKYNELL
jgi:predicted alpha/beta superfamily hydrolase